MTINFNLAVCDHLKPLRDYLIFKGCHVTYAGTAWSKDARLWIYFDSYFSAEKVKGNLKLDNCVVYHEHCGTHDGQESGLICTVHKDGVMGMHPSYANHTGIIISE